MAEWQDFVRRCMKAKNLKGQPREVIQRELRACVEAGRRVLREQMPREVNEEELARSIFGRR